MDYFYRITLFFTVNLALLNLGGCKEVKKGGQNFKVEGYEKHSSAEIRKGQTKLINPLLDCYDFEETSNRKAKDLKVKLEKYISEQEKNGVATEVSVYFRDLNNGPWIGINEDAVYSPASLLKVPIMIAAFEQEEEEPGFLQTKVPFIDPIPKDLRYKQNIVSKPSELVPGKEYTIERIIEEMIIKSDNISKDVLFGYLKSKYYKDIYYDLGIDLAKNRNKDNYLSVKDYASFFRILYNSTYLSIQLSEKALNLLTRTEFNQGIQGGVPNGTVIAHKFGERGYTNSNIKQLHDCGIVYNYEKPYLLCIMAKGKNFNELSGLIQNISKIVFEEANSKEE